ncbi:uncharacterized protein LOC115071025 isoform X2 [Nannospalax galili]|uniref:uncharacterized protein LOC115071025 isoform X2 n=1 Tax=Nannospalax galili TaxID=1026970 RepID=UPI00111C6626|nr:uncharacterized protein LOC115071025 isoform X2 [Nannospalax galili]
MRLGAGDFQGTSGCPGAPGPPLHTGVPPAPAGLTVCCAPHAAEGSASALRDFLPNPPHASTQQLSDEGRDNRGRSTEQLIDEATSLQRLILELEIWSQKSVMWTAEMLPKRDQKKASSTLELELHVVVSCHMGAGNGMQVLCSSKCSELLSHLSTVQVVPHCEWTTMSTIKVHETIHEARVLSAEPLKSSDYLCGKRRGLLVKQVK